MSTETSDKPTEFLLNEEAEIQVALDLIPDNQQILINRKIFLTPIAFLVIVSLSVGCRHPVTSKVSKQSSPISVYAAKLAKKTSKADRNKYYPIGRHWQNPTVFVDLSGISIILEGQPVRQATSIANLGRDLAALPASAWPLGRVVVFAQSTRIPVWLGGNPEPHDEAYLIVGKTIEILESLDLDIVYAPIN